MLYKLSEKNLIPFFANEYGFLSNFHASEVYLGGLIYATAEHAYQSCKTVDIGEKMTIKGCASPGQAKRYGQVITIVPNWDQIKRACMAQVLYAKFLQNPALIPQLLDTKDKILVEGNWWGDDYWGAVDYERTTDGIIRGANWLGRILMEVRNNFSENSK